MVGSFWPSLGKADLTVFAWQRGADTLVPWQGGALRGSSDAYEQQAGVGRGWESRRTGTGPSRRSRQVRAGRWEPGQLAPRQETGVA